MIKFRTEISTTQYSFGFLGIALKKYTLFVMMSVGIMLFHQNVIEMFYADCLSYKCVKSLVLPTFLH